LVSVGPGEVAFSDGEEPTRSMRVFERKDLISVIRNDFDSLSVDTENGTILATWNKDLEKDLLKFHNIPDIKAEILNVLSHNTNAVEVAITDYENPYNDLIAVDLLFEDENSIVEEAKKQAEDYVEDAAPIKEKKKYNYKKKPGRKKKPGPKPGSRRKKE
jgi:hypothetical protein